MNPNNSNILDLIRDNNPYDLSGTNKKLNSLQGSYYSIVFNPELSSLFDSEEKTSTENKLSEKKDNSQDDN